MPSSGDNSRDSGEIERRRDHLVVKVLVVVRGAPDPRACGGGGAEGPQGPGERRGQPTRKRRTAGRRAHASMRTTACAVDAPGT